MLSALVAIDLPFINESFFKLTFFLQATLNGLTNGAIYASMALTVVVIFKTTGHLNLAQGEMATLSAFVIYALSESGPLTLWTAIVVVMIVSAGMGAAVERFLIRPVETKSPVTVLIVTLGLYLAVHAVVGAVWGTTNRAPLQPFPSGRDARWVLIHGTPNLTLTKEALFTWITLAVLAGSLGALLKFTTLGLAYRGVASNRESARLVGVPVNRMLMLGWALAAGIGAVAAVMVSQNSDSLNFNLMGNVLIYGFAAACLGGFDSITGAVVGGLLVGLSESLLPNIFTFIGSEMGLGVALVVILAVLALKPTGLFGSRRVVRA